MTEAAAKAYFSKPYGDRQMSLHMATDLALEITEKAPGWEVVKIDNSGRGGDDKMVYHVVVLYAPEGIEAPSAHCEYIYTINQWQRMDKMPS